MSIPNATDAWFVEGTSNGAFDGRMTLERNIPIPALGDNECLVEMQAVSLNYRDLVIPKGLYPFPVTFPRIPCSDGAGIVVACGKNVTQFKKGDKVCTLFNQLHQGGPLTQVAVMTGLGGPIDGTLRRHAVFPDYGLVLAPTSLSPVEASTLSCAALTAWNALFGLESKAIRPGDVVLTQGTGGVSLFAIQFAKAAGATVIATTSSDDKAEKLRKLGADYIINYKATPNWGEAARDLTAGKVGVDHIVEVGGGATLRQSLKAVKWEGVITIIGFLAGPGAEDQPTLIEVIGKCTVRGIVVGSKLQFEAMNRAIDANSIRPVVDEKHFKFEEAIAAYHYQWDQKNFGKVVIRT